MSRMSRIGIAVVALVAALGAQHVLAASTMFNAHLTGKDVVPARETKATGEAKFTLSADGTQLEYRIGVGNIDNVVSAAIHVGTAGETGEAIAILYGPAAPGGGKANGVLTKGTLTAQSLIGSYAGRPLSDLVAAMQSGSVYVDVTTDDGTGGTNERPGDFSDGEIRGQVR